MATTVSSRTLRLLAALLVASALFQAQPALAMEVTVNEVQSSVRTNDGGGGGSYMGQLVKVVLQSLGQQASEGARQQANRRPQQPQ